MENRITLPKDVRNGDIWLHESARNNRWMINNKVRIFLEEP